MIYRKVPTRAPSGAPKNLCPQRYHYIQYIFIKKDHVEQFQVIGKHLERPWISGGCKIAIVPKYQYRIIIINSWLVNKNDLILIHGQENRLY